jgi:hypothetical protein
MTTMKQALSSIFIAGLLSATFFSILLTFSEASAQIPGITIVSGQYTNEEAGVTMTFPEGWEGAAISTDEGLIVTVAPGGMSGGEPTKMMGLFIMDKSKVETPPTDPSSLTSDADSDCGTPSTSTTQVSGVTASQIIVECTQDGVQTKAKMVVLETDTRWVSSMYVAPTGEFGSDVAAFDNALTTLKVNSATDIEGGSSTNVQLLASNQLVMLGGESLEVEVRSSSTISDFKLDEPSKTLSLKADGQTGTQGRTEIAIGKLLTEPYTVKIDGEATTDFEVNGAGADAMMTVSYTHSVHTIEVTGASVVPEFPVALVGVTAALVGIVAVIGRTKLFKYKIQ